MIRRILDRHRRRFADWEQHVDDALNLFLDDDPDEFTLGDALFLDEHGIEAT
jgi:hypothetical protein